MHSKLLRFSVALSGVLAFGAVSAPASGQVVVGAKERPASPGKVASAAAQSKPKPSAKELARARDDAFGDDWKKSPDLAWSLSGDQDGLNVLVADATDAYNWRTVARLHDPGFDTDRWIGNGCLSASGRRLAVVYAPRQFTNDHVLSARGASAAVVDLDTGAVRQLGVRASLAYFNPGCGAGETAVFTQDADENRSTRLLRVDLRTGKVQRPIDLDGQVTNAVPDGDKVLAVRGKQVVRVAPSATVTKLGETDGTASRLAVTPAGVTYLETDDKRSRAKFLAGGKAKTLAEGGIARIGLERLTDGRAVITGKPKEVASSLPKDVSVWKVDSSAALSSRGRAAVTTVLTPEDRAKVESDVKNDAKSGSGNTSANTSGNSPVPAQDGPLDQPADEDDTTVSLTFRSSKATVTVGVDTQSAATSSTVTATATATATATSGSATSAVEAERTCSVPRNDPRLQTYQPTPRQVEWAANQAVQNNLKTPRPANWKQSGLSSWTPQGLFPAPSLSGGGTVPTTILLGVLAQESNLWQASGRVLPGVTGNPLIGGYYGRPASGEDPYSVDFSKADCGYGIAQVTDGMVLASARRSSDAVAPYAYSTQVAVALDYQTNIAAGLRILADKWNTTRNAGMVINDGNPARLENWFYALWAYNSGFYPKGKDSSGQWGVGWHNNPANPQYDPNRPTFLDTYSGGGPRDAAHPGDWPYPERVLGFAAQSISKDEYKWVDTDGSVKTVYGGAGFRVGWWPGENPTFANANRAASKPPRFAFCNSSNYCNPRSVIGTPCEHRDPGGALDYKCWFHESVTWKNDCSATCGRDFIRFDTTYKEPGDGKAKDPNCSLSGLPLGARIVDNVPVSVPPVHLPCAIGWGLAGSFSLNFARASDGTYRSKVDFHQIGAGFGSHFYMTHLQNLSQTPDRKVTGTWTFTQKYTGWGRVLVHLPDHGAEAQAATYTIKGLAGGKTAVRKIGQAVRRNGWADLGVFQFAAQPVVTLTNEWTSSTNQGAIDRDSVAFDAVAMVPLSQKPQHFVVAIGDSYISGEGAGDYLRGTDQDGTKATRNACHRSTHAWPRKATLADNTSKTIGERADSLDPSLDLRFAACSFAFTTHMSDVGKYGEAPQLAQGLLDANTTLVVLSIGGNDARFGDLMEFCAKWPACPGMKFGSDTEILRTAEPKFIQSQVDYRVGVVVDRILTLAPNAKVVLMGYPPLFDSSSSDICTDPAIKALYDTTERAWIQSVTAVMNTTLKSAAARVAAARNRKVLFADPTAKFAGHDVCNVLNPAFKGIVLNLTPGDNTNRVIGDLTPGVSWESFHPDKSGTTLYASTFTTALRSLGY